MIDYALLHGQLYLGNKRVEFPFPVAEVVETPEGLVVRLDVLGRGSFPRNVFLVQQNGELRWQIQDPFDQDPLRGMADPSRTPFIGIETDKSGNLIAYHWLDADYNVDLETGAIRFLGFSR